MVDPVVIDQMLEVLRKHNVSKFKCAEFQLELQATLPLWVAPEGNPTEFDVTGDTTADLYDHLSFTPKFPDKAE